MQQVLTLIGTPEFPGGMVLDAALAVLAAAKARIGAVEDLHPARHAVEIRFAGAEGAEVEAQVRRALRAAPVDCAVQPAEGRRKRLLVADMESTIITAELLDEMARLAEESGRAGLGARIAAITARTMRGELDFAGALRERVALLAGTPAALLEPVRAAIELTPGARTLVQTMRAGGAYTALVTGGFDCFADTVRDQCGFDEARANHLLVEDGRIVGRVGEPVLDRDGKRAALEELSAAHRLSLAATAAIGDGANDIPMLQAAGLGVAFRGKPAVKAAARFRLDHADLTGLLYLQGYRAAEFRT